MENDLIKYQKMENFTANDKKNLDNLVRKVAKKGMNILEIGSWIGDSTVVLGRIAKDNGGMVYAVDHWLGMYNASEKQPPQDILDIFKYHIQKELVERNITIMPMESMAAVKVFKDKLFDVIFLDSDHSYEAVRLDLMSWTPKLKDGGLICGHDCKDGWPGVEKALDEFFKDYKVIKGSSIWYKKIWMTDGKQEDGSILKLKTAN